MRILLIHNSYQQRGGEDTVYEAERDLLRANGCEVVEYRISNDDVVGMNQLRLASGAVWSRRNYRRLRETIAATRPDVAHFHNTLPLISPSGYYAARREGVSVVQTLHNYRLICPSALLYRNDGICKDCVGKTVPWPAALHGCYRSDRKASATIVSMLAYHRAIGTYRKVVDRYIALTDFARKEYAAGGMPADRISVKPNFLAEDPICGVEPRPEERRGLLFVGRLTAEKGIRVILEAARQCDIPITVVGDGPLRAEVEQAVIALPGLEYRGLCDRAEVLDLMQRSRALLFPSTWYEGFPMTIVEAFACGLPVVSSDLGSMASIVEDEVNGLLVEPGKASAWAAAMARAANAPEHWGCTAREQFLSRYSAAQNFATLMSIYAKAGVDVPAAAPAESPQALAGPTR